MARCLTGVADENRVPTMRVRMDLTIDEFETLGKLADGRAKTVRVSRDVLARLLCDHSFALGKLRDCFVEIQEDQV